MPLTHLLNLPLCLLASTLYPRQPWVSEEYNWKTSNKILLIYPITAYITHILLWFNSWPLNSLKLSIIMFNSLKSTGICILQQDYFKLGHSRKPWKLYIFVIFIFKDFMHPLWCKQFLGHPTKLGYLWYFRVTIFFSNKYLLYLYHQ